MQSNNSRSYSHDDHSVNYVSGDSQPHHNYSYNMYSRAYPDQQGGQYYLPDQVANVNAHAAASDPRHYRPATSHGHRPSRSVADSRYNYSSSMTPHPSSSNTGHQSSYYSSSQYSSTSHGDRFIPTPSELASNHYDYSGQQMSQSPSMYTTPGHHQRRHPSTSPILTTRHSSTRPGHSQVSPVSPTATERFPCEVCGKTFSRSHDRKRHHETQHVQSPVLHRCRYCRKEFSRADSLKRHLDNGCDEAPSSSK